MVPQTTDPDAAEIEADKEKGKNAKTKKKTPGKKCPGKGSNQSGKKAACADADNTYEPQKYSQLRMEFINDQKESKGLSHSEANEAWNQSTLKRKLLSHVSVSELRRRRFIEKGCDTNPWATPAEEAKWNSFPTSLLGCLILSLCSCRLAIWTGGVKRKIRQAAEIGGCIVQYLTMRLCITVHATLNDKLTCSKRLNHMKDSSVPQLRVPAGNRHIIYIYMWNHGN